MSTTVLKVFSYLPNPRVWKALIAAELCDVTVEVVGDEPAKLSGWLWDVDARPLRAEERDQESPHARTSRRGFAGTLYKTDAFLRAHPFGTVPAAFSADGTTGVFESNSILRAVARLGAENCQLYGSDGYEASRIDGFLDANLVFAREAQVYLLGMSAPSEATHARMLAAYEFYLSGVDAALSQGAGYLATDDLSIADISFVCDFAQFLREGHYEEQLREAGLALVSVDGPERYPRAFQHMLTLAERKPFAQVLGSYLDWFRRKLG